MKSQKMKYEYLTDFIQHLNYSIGMYNVVNGGVDHCSECSSLICSEAFGKQKEASTKLKINKRSEELQCGTKLPIQSQHCNHSDMIHLMVNEQYFLFCVKSLKRRVLVIRGMALCILQFCIACFYLSKCCFYQCVLRHNSDCIQ